MLNVRVVYTSVSAGIPRTDREEQGGLPLNSVLLDKSSNRLDFFGLQAVVRAAATQRLPAVTIAAPMQRPHARH